MQNAKIAIFDFDGTLVRTESCLVRITEKVIADLGIEWDKEKIKNSLGDNTETRFRSYGIALSVIKEARSRFFGYHIDDEYEEAILVPSIGEWLSRHYDMVHVVVSNSPSKPVISVLERFGIRKRFLKVICNDTPVAINKIRMFRNLAQSFASNGIWVFGDEGGEIVAGHYIGACTFLLSNSRNVAIRNWADFVIDDYGDFEGVFQKGNWLLLRDYAHELGKWLTTINQAVAERLIEGILQRVDSSLQVIIAGNGGSMALAKHFAADITKVALGADRRIRIHVLGSNEELLSACSNDGDWTISYSNELSVLAGRRDLLIVVSSSGCSENILALIEMGKARHLSLCVLDAKALWGKDFTIPAGQYEDAISVLFHYATKKIRAAISRT